MIVIIFFCQREIDQEAKGTSQQNEDKKALKKPKSQSVKATPYATRKIEQKGTTRPGSITGKTTVSQTTGKENVPEKIAAKKGKVSSRQIYLLPIMPREVWVEVLKLYCHLSLG